MPGFSNNFGVAIGARPTEQNINALLGGTKWSLTTVSYNFPSSVAAYPLDYGTERGLANFMQLSAPQRTATELMFNQYLSPLVNLTFSRVADTAIADISTARADILNNDGSPFTVGYAYLPSTGSNSGDIWYRNNGGIVGDPVLGNYSWLTFLHEIGHAMGLKHGHEVEGAIPALTADRNSMEFSAMTYAGFIGADTAAGYSNEEFGFAQTLMMYDIAALQYMYGANYTINNSNSIYTFNPNTGEMSIDGVGQGAPGANRIFRTLWDGGGVDTYDLSNYTTNLSIDLTPGGWSTFSAAQLANLGQNQTARANLFNALLFNGDTRSLIENAFGGSGNDRIVGNQGANSLAGNAGADTLIGGAGSDVLNGGDGFDTVDYSAEGGSQGISLNLLLSNGFDSFGAFETIISVEAISATNFNDVIYTLNTGDAISGFGGADQIVSWGGDDVVDGGAGNDVILAWTGNDTALGGADDDYLWMGDGADRGNGGVGTDVLVGDLPGSSEVGNDTLIGDLGTDILLGGAGDDLLYGGLEETLVGSDAGNRDWLIGGAGNDTMHGGGGDDVIWEQLDSNEGGADQAFGGDGNDLILTGLGNDVINGGAGNDTVYGGAGADAITLGAGADLAFLTATGDFGDTYADFVSGEDKLALYSVLGGAKTTAQAFADGTFQLSQAGGDVQLLYAATLGGPTTVAATFTGLTVASFNIGLDFI